MYAGPPCRVSETSFISQRLHGRARAPASRLEYLKGSPLQKSNRLECGTIHDQFEVPLKFFLPESPLSASAEFSRIDTRKHQSFSNCCTEFCLSASEKLWLVLHLRSQGSGFASRNRISGKRIVRSNNCIVVMFVRGGHQLSGARLLLATLLTEFEYFAPSGRKFMYRVWLVCPAGNTGTPLRGIVPAFLPTKDVTAFWDCSNDCIHEHRFISLVVWFGSPTFKDLASLLATDFLENGLMRSKNCMVVMCLHKRHP